MSIKFLNQSMSSAQFLKPTPKVAMFSDKRWLNYDWGYLCGTTSFEKNNYKSTPGPF
jgi:hypothetical protein